LKRNGMELGSSVRTLRTVDNGNFVYESATQASGVIAWLLPDHVEETTTWSYNDGMPRPLEYLYLRHGGHKNRSIRVSFDWTHNTVTNDVQGGNSSGTWHMPVPPDTQDKLLYQLSIIHDLQNGRRQLHYHVADGGKRLKSYDFAIQGEEDLDTALGRLKTVRLERIGDERDTTVWCAPSLFYIPVQIEQHEADGSQLTMYIAALHGIPKF
jgi:hypothetical protein